MAGVAGASAVLEEVHGDAIQAHVQVTAVFAWGYALHAGGAVVVVELGAGGCANKVGVVGVTQVG